MYQYCVYMTCFWNGLIQGLGSGRIQSVLKYKMKNNNERKTLNIKTIISLLQKHNCLTTNVLYNNTILTDRELNENYNVIANFSSDNIREGYDCSISDPFLLLVCEVFRVNINFCYNSIDVTYKNETVIDGQSRQTINFRCDEGHFMCD